MKVDTAKISQTFCLRTLGAQIGPFEAVFSSVIMLCKRHVYRVLWLWSGGGERRLRTVRKFETITFSREKRLLIKLDFMGFVVVDMAFVLSNLGLFNDL